VNKTIYICCVKDSYLAFELGEAEFTMINPPKKRQPRSWEPGDILVTIAYCGAEGQDGVFRGARAWIAGEKEGKAKRGGGGAPPVSKRPGATTSPSA
jgi:hypothetical protein